MFKTSVLALLIAAFSPLLATGPQDLWKSDESPGHYFLLDQRTNTYVETIDCKAVFRFTIKGGSSTGLRLYDASRNLYVELQNGTMWLFVNGATSWQKFRKGRFDRRVTYTHVDAGGAITGNFWKKDACQWAEFLDGTATPTFRFNEISTDASAVVMYDHSRNIYVKLENSKMSLRTGGTGNFVFFKKGYWD